MVGRLPVERLMAALLQRRWWQLPVAAVLAGAAAVVFSAGYTSPIDSYAACVDAGYPVLDTNPPICRDGPRSFTGTPAPTPPTSAPVTNTHFEILVDGDTKSRLPDARQDVINTQARWEEYWRQIHAGLPQLPPLIPVDFTASTVAGVALGPEATTGYSLKITSINTGPFGSTISVTQSTPTITCRVEKALTNHYLIVRADKLADPVSFRITNEKRHCQ